MPKFNYKPDFIPVSTDFIENYMPKANGAYVKVYLLSLHLSMSKGEMTTAQMASILNLIESDVVNALDYWNKEGVLVYSNDNVLFKGAEEVPANNYTDNNNDSVSKKSISQISDEISSNKMLADLCALSQEILGKPLKDKDIETLYWFYDELGLSPEVITILLEYCVSKDKRNMNYIEKVAISWHKNGIVTLEAADKYINAEKEKGNYLYSIKKLLGIDNRNLTKTEETYLKTWHDSYGMDENMVGLAYEYCVAHTNKMSFPYMNSILKRWNEIGIHTIEAAEKDHNDFKNKNNNTNLDVYSDNNVDYDELEKMMQDNM